MFLVFAFLLEFALWMRGFWPWDSDLVQIVVTIPMALMLTAFTFKDFALLLRMGGAWIARTGKRIIRTG